jgi:hypothetical protein
MYELDRCVFIASGDAEAQQVRAFLRSSGILSKVRGESIGKVHGLSVGDLAAVEILVSEIDEEEARSLLRSVEAGEFHLDEDVETGT